jgi:flagellar FliL protein
MSDAAVDVSAKKLPKGAEAGGTKGANGPRRMRPLLIAGAALLVVGAAAAGAYAFVPAVADGTHAMFAALRGALPGQAAAPAAGAAEAKSAFIELPEMTLTLPNGGRPRQIRLTLAIEVAGDPALVQPSVLSPRVFDSLILYLRTLRDSELDGALAIDRLRGDLYRRLDLLLGPNVVRDVLITGLVVA